MFDKLIKNAFVVDGSGEPEYRGDIAIKDGKIIVNPENSDNEACANEVIDATGLVLCPGFIDAHCHEDETLGNYASSLSKVSQGITTVCAGHCGESVFPISTNPKNAELFRQNRGGFLAAPDCGYKEEINGFTSFEKYLEYASKRNVPLNYTMFTGHIPLRIATMGFENRRPTEKELDEMKALLRETLEHGSRGLSIGLIYSPSCYSEKEELIELCRVVAEYQGFLAVHLRNEAGDFENSMQEAIDIARAAGCALNLSHHKACGKENWGKTKKTLQMIKDAKAEGMEIYTDVYPYLATGNYLNICLPKEFFAEGPERAAKKLKDPEVRAQMKEAILSNPEGRYRNCGGFENITICSAPFTPEAMGRTVAAYAASLGKDEFETYFDLCVANGDAAQAAYLAMCDEDLERCLLDENAVICTDSYDISESNTVHPRAFGSFPLCLGKYVREKKLMSLEAMIHRMSGRTAQFLHLGNKGLIRNGYDADLVLFNPDTVNATSDFSNTRSLSEGIEKVFVAGHVVYENKDLTGNYPGRFLPFKA
ncbi:MAG: D-aminoacylase [Eubacteriales bacterium]|nr:D-aminoacylase [Eubacteriales bacterium]